MTNKLFKYRATGKGTLSRPYRFFKEGDIITSLVPLEHPALVDAATPIKQKSDILVPYMTINGRKQRPDYADARPKHATELSNRGVPTISDKQYERGMDGVKRFEKIMDGAEDAAKAAQAAQPTVPAVDPEVDNKNDGGAGTGNQDVI